MKRICLIRHAHTPPGSPDESRELSEYGKQQARWMGGRLADHVTAPDMIVCSPAIRTRQTAGLVSESFGMKGPDIRIERMLYESTLEDYLDVLKQIDEKASSVWLVGHNWAITALAQNLTGENRLDMVPCTAVWMVFEAEDWRFVCSANRLETTTIRPPESGEI